MNKQTKLYDLCCADSASSIAEIGATLAGGGLVAIPTETVYGLAANALDVMAVQRIFAAKGRPADNPLIVHIAEKEDIALLARDIPDNAYRLLDAFSPGPLTIVLKARDTVPRVVTGGLNTVAIRIPDCTYTREIIRAAACPIAAPSANISGRPSPTCVQAVLDDLRGKIDAVADGGPCRIGLESTVLDVTGVQPVLLRLGAITRDMIEAVVGPIVVPLKQEEDVAPKSPGLKYAHYAPCVPMTLVCGNPDDTAQYIRTCVDFSVGVLCFDEYFHLFEDICGGAIAFGAQQDTATQAAKLFAALRHFDGKEVTHIYAQCPPDTGIGAATAERLLRAAGHDAVWV